MNIDRWREQKEDGSTVIHAGRPDGLDMTLCGYAEEGACMSGDDTGLTKLTRGKISCPDCIGIIRFGKKFPARFLAA